MCDSTEKAAPAKKHHVCKWWMAYLFDNPIRRLIHPPEKVLGPYVTRGMVVLDFGCGFGHYSLGMAKMVGDSGHVTAADVQQIMLDKTNSRARKAGLDHIVQTMLCNGSGIGATPDLDFALICNTLHETPDPEAVLQELYALLKPGALCLVMEPPGHVKTEEFETETALARKVGFLEKKPPKVFRQMCCLLQKPDDKVNS